MGATVPVRDDAALREEVVATLKRKRKFWDDAAAFVVVNGILWVIWAITDRTTDNSLPWPAWVTMVWAFLLALDGWRAFGRLRRPITETEIDAELRKLEPR